MQIQIVQLERNLTDGTVTIVHWSATEQDGEHSARAVGTVSLERNEDSATFIPFDELTEEKVIEWVEAEWDSPEEMLIAKVEKKKNPVTATGMPWSEVTV